MSRRLKVIGAPSGAGACGVGQEQGPAAMWLEAGGVAGRARSGSILSREDRMDPEHEALLADSVGLALHIVLEKLTPPERLAFVLHDMFAVLFEDIALIIERSPPAARQLASRARRRVGREPGPGRRPDPPAGNGRCVLRSCAQMRLRGARGGARPGRRAAGGCGVAQPGASIVVFGARAVAARALTYASLAPLVRPAPVNGAAGVVVTPEGRLFSVLGFTVVDGRIVEIDAILRPGARAPHGHRGPRRLTRPRGNAVLHPLEACSERSTSRPPVRSGRSDGSCQWREEEAPCPHRLTPVRSASFGIS